MAGTSTMRTGLFSLLQRLLAAAPGEPDASPRPQRTSNPSPTRMTSQLSGNATLDRRGTHRPVHHGRLPGRPARSPSIAGALAATDPDRTARIIADAERAAQSITDDYWEGQRARQHRGRTGSHRPGPHRPDHRRRGTRRPVHHGRLPGRPARSPASRGHWQSPTRSAPPGSSPTRNAPPGPSPARTRRPARSPGSRGHWQPPTRTARNAPPSRSPTRAAKASALARIAEVAGSHRPGPRRPRTAQSITDDALQGQRARQHRGGTGSHRPGPRRPDHRRGTHRPVHHRRLP